MSKGQVRIVDTWCDRPLANMTHNELRGVINELGAWVELREQFAQDDKRAALMGLTCKPKAKRSAGADVTKTMMTVTTVVLLLGAFFLAANIVLALWLAGGGR